MAVSSHPPQTSHKHICIHFLFGLGRKGKFEARIKDFQMLLRIWQWLHKHWGYKGTLTHSTSVFHLGTWCILPWEESRGDTVWARFELREEGALGVYHSLPRFSVVETQTQSTRKTRRGFPGFQRVSENHWDEVWQATDCWLPFQAAVLGATSSKKSSLLTPCLKLPKQCARCHHEDYHQFTDEEPEVQSDHTMK